LNGSLDPTEVLANCAWYCNANEQELKRIFTDSGGVSHTYSLGIGKIDPNIKHEQIKAAKAILPPPLAEVFQKIEHPFVQAITDNLAPKSVFMSGKVFLVGDALAGLRPHTAAGTAQAAMNALLLKNVFGEDGGMGIEEWEKATVDWAKFAQNLGVQMGNSSQFGNHPAYNGESPK
jgi:2-polyprenyl-6-methoxyphenol hydroxylase-like FAD-dependent oxidoreductase